MERLAQVIECAAEVELDRLAFGAPLALVAHVDDLSIRVIDGAYGGAACQCQELTHVPFDPYVLRRVFRVGEDVGDGSGKGPVDIYLLAIACDVRLPGIAGHAILPRQVRGPLQRASLWAAIVGQHPQEDLAAVIGPEEAVAAILATVARHKRNELTVQAI